MHKNQLLRQRGSTFGTLSGLPFGTMAATTLEPESRSRGFQVHPTTNGLSEHGHNQRLSVTETTDFRSRMDFKGLGPKAWFYR